MRTVVAGMIVVAALAACSDTSEPEDEGLTRNQALELAEHLSAAIETPAAMLLSGGSGMLDQDITVPCMRGGNNRAIWHATMNVDQATSLIGIHALGTYMPMDCAIDAEGGGTYVLSGAPDIDFDLSAQMRNGVVISFSVDENGAFSWRRGGSSGTCTVAIRSALNPATNVYTVSGMFCGFEISQSSTASRPMGPRARIFS